MNLTRCLLITILILGVSYSSFTQHSDSLSLYKKRKILTHGALSAGYVTSSYLLYNNWYKNQDLKGFHFHNDWNNWRKMDKLGHMQATYMQTAILHDVFKWSGTPPEYAASKAALFALGFQTAIEIMDGFSDGWGFSPTDMLANGLGAGAFVLQERIWSEQKFRIKFAYHSNPIQFNADIPDKAILDVIKAREESLFGSQAHQQFFKNYNNHSVWLSSSPSAWNKESSWPEFLSLAVGYRAGNMLGAQNNSWLIDGEVFDAAPYLKERYSSWILALDYNLASINTKSKFLNTILDTLNHFKWPAPAVELRSDGSIHFHLLFLN